MRVFFDTNVILEFLLERENFDDAKRVADMVDRGEIQALFSGLTFDTITYVLDLCFKKKGMDKSTRIQTLRRTLNILLAKFDVALVTKDILMQALNDNKFEDIEDSCQHQIAFSAGCDCILTFNKKEFVSSSLAVMPPKEFCDKVSSL